jgi:AraC-like DNA-binding protein
MNVSMNEAANPGITNSLSLRCYGTRHAGHAHAHTQVLWACSGALQLRIGGSALALAPGSACAIPSQAWHDFAASPASACLVLDTNLELPSRLQACLLDSQPMAGLLRWLQQAAAAPRAEVLLRSAQPLLQASLLEADLLDAGSVRCAPWRQRRAIDWPALQSWVDARLDTPLQVADLAARVHLSATQFSLRCIEEQALPPAAWLRNRRLLKAQALRRRGCSATQAALACGYASASALIAALRRQRG